jgi:hypothetical protein
VAFAQTAPVAPAAVPPGTPETLEAAKTPPAPPCAPPEEQADEQDTLTPVEPAPEPPADAEAAASDVEAHCSQNAGNQQYQDPFAGAKPPGGGNGGSSQNGSGGGDGSTAPATSTTTSGALASQGEAAGQDTGTTAESAGPGLPNTGLGLGGLVAFGLPLLAGGLALRARLA